MNIEIPLELAHVLGAAAVKRAEEIETKATKFSADIQRDMVKLATGLRTVATELFKVPV